MGIDWIDTTLGACTDQLAGFAFKSKHYTSGGEGVRLLRGDNVAPGGVRWAGAREYPTSLTAGLERYALLEGDVVVAMDRPWIDAGLKVARVLKRDTPCLLVQRVTRLRSTPAIDAGFLWAVAQTSGLSAHLQAETTGTAVPHISGAQIASFRLKLPPPPEQRAIGSVLTALDDKIESNRRLASSLADVALAQGAHASKAAKRTTSLAAIAVQIKVPGEPPLPYVGLDVMPQASTVLTEWTADGAPGGASWSFSRGDVLYGKLRPYFRKVAVAPIEGRCTREIVVLRPQKERYYGLLVSAVASVHFIDFCTAISSGTKMPRAEWREAAAYEVGLPDDETLGVLADAARRNFGMVASLVGEARTVTAIRNALLPKLVSGQIRVPLSVDPEEGLGAAVEALDAASA